MVPSLKKSIQSAFFVISLIFGSTIHAQDFGEIIAAGAEDANTYLEKYLNPAMGSLGNGLANGWYNTAKAHKTLGFDLTLSFNMAQIPTAERTFQFIESEFNNMRLNPGTENTLPTMVGGDAPVENVLIEAGNIQYQGQTIPLNEDIEFAVPSGINLDNVPVVTGLPIPTVNLGIGIYKNTDLKIRLIPETNIDDFSIKMFGIGVLHDIKQWIPGIKNLPFDLSGFFGTTKLTSTIALDVDSNQTGTLGTQTRFYSDPNTDSYGEFVANSTTIQALVSKKLAVFTPYIGVGVNIVNTQIAVKGDYIYEITPPQSQTQTYNIQDPVNLTFEGSGGPRFTIGGRLKLAVFTFHFDYTAQKYSTITGGFGIAIR